MHNSSVSVKRQQPTSSGHALRLATDWTDTAQRYVACVWQALTTPRATSALLRELNTCRDWMVRNRFGPACFPTMESFNLLAVVHDSIAGGVQPTIAGVMAAMERRGWTAGDVGIGGGDLAAELEQVLNCECSAAGLANFAAHMLDYSRKAKLSRILRDKYRNTLEPGASADDIVAELAAAFAAWRDGA